MEKRSNHYHLHLQEVSLKDGAEGSRSLALDFDNHDDLFHIVEVIQSKNIFEEQQTAKEFALGLKLFTEVMLKNKQHPLFEELRPAIGAFMNKLKNY